MLRLNIFMAKNLLFYLGILTGFFLLLEISFYIQCNGFYLSDFTFMADKMQIPYTIIPDIIYFVFAELLVHSSFCLLIWLASLLIANLLQLSTDKTLRLGIFLWSYSVITVIVANQYLYPNSKFNELTEIIIFSPLLTQYLFYLLALGWCMWAFVLLSSLIHFLLKRPPYMLCLLALLPVLFFVPFKTRPTNAPVHEQGLPNIILVGIDSLRPDFLSYFGGETNTPFISHLLNQAVVFSEAVTPLARTFPSWTSILTGQYPLHHQARSNLTEQALLNLQQALPRQLQQAGYETIYATDETRFSNIDKNYGFEEIISPPMGLNDFLLGTFNDFPLTNLLINTQVGRILFPYSYGNRPVYFSYDPDSFIQLLKPMITRKRKKPVFLAMHFCLPHYPYLWASLPGNQYKVIERYPASIARVDQQIQDVFALLKDNHWLDNAIVILLSDHGEALELDGDRITELERYQGKDKIAPKFYPPSLEKEAINQSAGHGTDVLGLPQYHSLFAIKFFGKPTLAKTVPGIVSLLDIQPTLLALLNLPNANSDGQSLAPIILGDGNVVPLQHIFLESDFTPQAIRTVHPQARDVVYEGIELFQIDPKSARLTVKKEMLKMIIESKQVADIYGEWMLALYPQNKQQQTPILINLKTGEWTNDLHSALANRSPAQIMLQKLQTFYTGELKRVD